MESRMEKYYENDSKVLPARTKKNERLYKSLSSEISEFDSLPVPDNSNVIDANGLKQIISSRDEYRRSKQNDRTFALNRPLVEDEIKKDKKKDDKIYDINVLLENAKNEINRSASVTNERKIDVNFLNSLEDANILNNNDDAMEIATPQIEKKEHSNTDSLPLDILADLKGNDNTIVTDPIVKDEVTMIKKIKDGETFYSGSFNFSKKDFDEDDDPFFEEESHNGIKIFFLVFGLLVLAVAISFIIMKYVL